MMRERLLQMLHDFESNTGKTDLKILCGRAAFEKLFCEENDDWRGIKFLDVNNGGGYAAEFMGVPIQIIHNPHILEDDAACVLPKDFPVYWNTETTEEFLTDHYGQWYTTIHEEFPTYYYVQWNTTAPKEEELPDIREDALMSVLNGGGFNSCLKPVRSAAV